MWVVAAQATHGSLERAADWLFSHADDLDSAVASVNGAAAQEVAASTQGNAASLRHNSCSTSTNDMCILAACAGCLPNLSQLHASFVAGLPCHHPGLCKYLRILFETTHAKTMSTFDFSVPMHGCCANKVDMLPSVQTLDLPN